ncbi:fibronectin type 3 domain-containing protein [Oceanihabitans sediminis]|nr:hypothetical protein [Oceanihabitans sediminis]RBP34405.1 fibronectin type 3 domain-containing protein [Oceanihabitans sediminis]
MKYLKARWVWNTFFIIFSISGMNVAFGQETKQQILLPGPNGVHISTQNLFDYPVLKEKRHFPSPDQKIIIWKSDAGKKKMQKVTELSFPGSPKEMQKKLGEKGSSIILKKLNANNMDEAYSLIKQHGVDTLGLAIISPIVQEAFGLTYVDSSWEVGQKVSYHFDRVSSNKAEKDIYSESLNGKLPQYTSKYKLLQYWSADSIAFTRWGAKVPSSESTPLYAQLYTLEASKKEFSVADLTYINRTDTDSTYVSFSKPIKPNSRIAWYIRTIDAAGNLGKPSDTLYAIHFNKNKIAPIENLKVRDTLNSLLVTWKPLPSKAYYTAIQILKSRKLGEDYVVLDTIAPSKSSFMDKQVIPGSSYFYKVRPLLFDLPGVEPMVFTEASGYKEVSEELAPSTPQGLQAVNKEGKITLSWLPNPELNIFGYYVLRGTSLNNMKVINGPIKSHHYIDSTFSKSYSGQYTYALQVLNNGQKMSDTSKVVSVSIRQATVLLSPGGVQARRVPEGIHLEWENTRIKDNSIVGYILYRREKGEATYQLLSNKPISLPAFLDSNTISGKNYEYAVSSIDAWGNQSILSPFVSVSADSDSYLKPPSSISLRNLSSGIEVSWPKPYDAGTREYVIYRSAIKSNSFDKIATVNPASPYVDKNVQENTLYKYAISVKSNNKEGSKSSEQLIRR